MLLNIGNNKIININKIKNIIIIYNKIKLLQIVQYNHKMMIINQLYIKQNRTKFNIFKENKLIYIKKYN